MERPQTQVDVVTTTTMTAVARDGPTTTVIATERLVVGVPWQLSLGRRRVEVGEMVITIVMGRITGEVVKEATAKEVGADRTKATVEEATVETRRTM